jgi:hypothetical protein
MKTTTSEVLCDACGQVIPVMYPTAIFATLRGPEIRHKKLDVCNMDCLAAWAIQQSATTHAVGRARPTEQETPQ